MEFESLSGQAVQAQRAGQTKSATQLYLKALEIRPTWADGWRNVGMLLADEKDYRRAEAAFRNLLDIEPRNGAGWAMLGLCEYEQGRYDAAYAHIQRGRALGVGNADLEKVALYHAALIMILFGEFPDAETLLKQLAGGGVGDPDLITAFGLAALRISKPAEKLEPQELRLVERVGQLNFQALRSPVTESIRGYEKLLQEMPAGRGLHYAFGSFLINVAQYHRGLEEVAKELEINPRDLMALLLSALTYVKTNQPERALPFAEKAAQLAPGKFAPHYALGLVLLRVGETRRAIAELEQAVKIVPESTLAHQALSQAYWRAGRKADSARESKIFVQLKKQRAPEGGPRLPSAQGVPSTPQP